jgi:aubergine
VTVGHHRIQIWPGYLTSIRQYENDILLNCKLASKVMREENVYQIIQESMRQGGNYRDTAARKVIGTTVMTDYNKESYKVSDIDWDSSPNSTFETRNGDQRFADYYLRKYGKNVRDMGQPLLVAKPTARNIRGGQDRLILLVPEFCRATGLTDQMRTNFGLMRDMAQYTRLNPREYIERLSRFNGRLQGNENATAVFNQNGMALERNLVEFDGRRLPQEIIEFGNKRKVDLVRHNADWTRELQGKSMYMTVNLTNWFIVCPRISEQKTKDFYNRHFKQVCQGFNMRTTDPEWNVIEDNNHSYAKALEGIMRKDPQFILVVVKTNASDRYAAIKRITLCPETNRPVPVQVICDNTMTPKKGSPMSIATKVVIQVNCKLGGIPWIVDLKLSGLMIVGFDVSHDTSDRSKSYGAMVASLDPMGAHGGYYYSAVNQHVNGESLSEHFGLNIIGAIRKYVDLIGTLPKKILIYRDGVGDGQINQVVNQELDDIKSKVKKMYGDQNPRIGFVILNKQTNTRFVTKNPRSGNDNPLPGTIVDDVITLPER